MPTVTYTPEELEALKVQQATLNARGLELGCHVCPVCGDSQLWKPFHEVTYRVGRITHVEIGSGQHGAFEGSFGHMALCEECWAKTSVDERVAHHKARHGGRAATIPSIAKIPTDSGLDECPEDRQRHAREIDAHKCEWKAIEAAIRDGTVFGPVKGAA